MTTESDENPVASSLGKTTLSDWIGFAKIAIPSIGIAIPVLLFPVEHYLDSREEAFFESLQTGTSADIAEIKAELLHLEGEIKGDLRSSPTTVENMEKLADLRERVVRLEAILDRDRGR